MSIADKLQALVDIKADIKAAIEDKGVLVGDAPFAAYAGLIEQIEGGEPIPVAPTNTELPVISGVNLVGQLLFCSLGAWTGNPTDYEFQWLRGTSPIDGATSQQYENTAEDDDAFVTCDVVAINAGGTSAPARATPVIVSTPANTVTLNPADKTTDMILSNDNLTGTHDGTEDIVESARATLSRQGNHATNGWYFEFRPQALLDDSGFTAVGLATGTHTLTNALGGAESLGWTYDGGLYQANETLTSIAPMQVGVWHRVAVKNSLAWFAVGSGNWNNNPSANPATGAGGIDLADLMTVSNFGSVFPIIAPVVPGEVFDANFGTWQFQYGAPSGFQGWTGFSGNQPIPGQEPAEYEELQLIAGSMGLNEAPLSGVPPEYNWSQGGGVNVGHYDPTKPDYGLGERGRRWTGPFANDFEWAVPWGQVYKADGATLQEDLVIEISDIRMLLLIDGHWILLTSSNFPDGAAYLEDFSDDDNVEQPYITPPFDAQQFKLIEGRNYHYYTGRAFMTAPELVEGVIVVSTARLLSDNDSPIDPETQRVLVGVGGDYWEEETTPWDNFESHDSIMMSAHVLIGENPRRIYASSMTLAELVENPPPAWMLGAPIELTEPSAFGPDQWAVTAGDESADVTIHALPYNGGAAIEDVEYRVDEDTWISSGGVGNFSITGLTNDVQVSVDLRAVNSVGAGPASAPKLVTPEAPSAADVPDAFGDEQWLLTVGDERLTVVIDSLPDDNGEDITDIEYRVDGGTWTSSGGIVTFDITGLTNGVEVDVEIRAVNSEGAGPASSVKAATPNAAPVNTALPVVTGVALVNQYLHCDDLGTWDNPVDSLEIQWLRNEAVIDGATGTPYLCVAGDDGEDITARVRAIGPGGQTDAVATAVTVTTPANEVKLSGSDKSTSISISNDGFTATHGAGSGVAQGVRATLARAGNSSSDGWYFEFRPRVLLDTTDFTSAGLAVAAHNINNALGGANSLGYAYNGDVWRTNDFVATIMAMDEGAWHRVCVKNNLFWVSVEDGNWNNNGSADPETGAGGLSISLLTSISSSLFPAVAPVETGEVFDFNFGYWAFEHPVPSGFAAWTGFVGNRPRPV